MNHMEKAYTTKELSVTLKIGDSTLRKWCLALEKNDYQFLRNEQNNRLFVEKDLVVLRHFQTLVQDNNFSLENAALVVASKFKEVRASEGTGIVPQEKKEEEHSLSRSDEVVNKLLDYVERQEKFNQELLRSNRELMQRLDDQQRYIDERLEARDQNLMNSLRQLNEIKQLQLEQNQMQNEKKGLIARLFGK